MATLTHAPADLVIATSDGIAVRFAGIEIGVTDWQGAPCIAVTLEAVRGQATWDRDVELEHAREAWAARLKSLGSDQAGEAPAMPGVAVLGGVAARLSDDVGTTYARTTGQVAGDGGTEWRATWFFAPLPPAEARELRLQFHVGAEPFAGQGGEPTGAECRVALN